ncbi:MAG: RNA polymerase sigma factor [Planctomycetota bacterium]
MPVAAMTTARETDFASIVHGYQSNIWWYLRLLGADPSLADDLTQETFLAAWKAGMQRNEPATFGTYLRRAARSVFIRASQQRRRRPQAMPDVDLDAADAAWTALHGDDPDAGEAAIDQLRECVDQLAPQAKRAIELQYHEGRPGEQTADELGISHGHLRVIIHRARQLLRRCMEAHR